MNADMLRAFVARSAGDFQKHGAILPGDSLKHGTSRLLSVSYGCLCGRCASLTLFALLVTFKNMTTRELSTLDTPYTLDTYNTFSLDCEEALIDDGKTYDDYEWEYDIENYLQALADNWGKLMRANILDNVLKNITVTGKAYSPREYNFTTDNAPIAIEYDQEALHAYIEAHKEQYEAEKRRSHDGYMWLGEEEDNMIMWYLSTVSASLYSIGSYILDQYDDVSECEYVSGMLRS